MFWSPVGVGIGVGAGLGAGAGAAVPSVAMVAMLSQSGSQSNRFDRRWLLNPLVSSGAVLSGNSQSHLFLNQERTFSWKHSTDDAGAISILNFLFMAEWRRVLTRSHSLKVATHWTTAECLFRGVFPE